MSLTGNDRNYKLHDYHSSSPMENLPFPKNAPPSEAGLDHEVRSNLAMVFYLAATLVACMFISQEAVPEIGSFVYWLLLLPGIVLPLLNLRAIMLSAFSWPMILLLAMLITSGIWNLFAGDPRAILRIVMLTVVLIWISTDLARIRISQFVGIYLGILLLGVFVYLLTPLNKWGPLPGLTVAEYGVWRVSFFPNIAYTAFLSLFMFMVLTSSRTAMRHYFLVLVVAIYFTFTPFVRTATIGLFLYIIMIFLLKRLTSPRKIFWTAVSVAVLANVAIAVSPILVHYFQSNPIVSRILLRGETNLDMHDIYIQLFRPWVWSQHIKIFLSSPYLMGWGNFDFNTLKTESLIDIIDWSDTVSMPTRLLASHGLPALLFAWFGLAQLARRSDEMDVWACACFPTIVLTAMQWGSLFHPSDPMFFLLFLILTRGRRMFPDQEYRFALQIPCRLRVEKPRTEAG